LGKIFFKGIKGAGMSALAQILHDKGNFVAGEDVPEYFYTEDSLIKKNIAIYNQGLDEWKKFDEIIVSNNLENHLTDYLDQNRKAKTYTEKVIELMNEAKISIGVAGTHGKTTTTKMLTKIFQKEQIDSLIGDGTGVGVTTADYFIFESDEYKKRFLNYYPDYSIITNVDFDHPDTYIDLEDSVATFSKYISNNKKVFVNGDDNNFRSELAQHDNVTTFGIQEQNIFRAVDIRQTPDYTQFSVEYSNQLVGKVKIHLSGIHNVYNALAAFSLSYALGIDVKQIIEALENVQPAQRRFNVTNVEDFILVDDFAHHPTEIMATIDSLNQQFPDKEKVIIFQPHTFSRTKAFLKQYVALFQLVDFFYISDIYKSQREKESTSSMKDVLNNIHLGNHYIDLNHVKQLIKYNDAVIVFMGAGDIVNYKNRFIKCLKE
jgi:UDP-N-acetylmuramate--alanine ligase